MFYTFVESPSGVETWQSFVSSIIPLGKFPNETTISAVCRRRWFNFSTVCIEVFDE